MLKCHASNSQKTQDLLVGKVNDLNDLTPLKIAIDAEFKEFAYVEPSLNLLNKTFTKGIDEWNKCLYFPVSFSY